MRVSHDHGVVIHAGAGILQRNCIELRVKAGVGADGGRIDRPAVGQSAGRVNQVHVALVSEIARAGAHIAEGEGVVLRQLAGDLHAGVNGVRVLVAGSQRDDAGRAGQGSAWQERKDVRKGRRVGRGGSEGIGEGARGAIGGEGFVPQVGGGCIVEGAEAGPHHRLGIQGPGQAHARREVLSRRAEVVGIGERRVIFGRGRLKTVPAQAINKQEIGTRLPAILHE